jgi:hypothetical protein
MFNNFVLCAIVTLAVFIIMRQVFTLFKGKITDKMYDMVYVKIKPDDCYVYRASKENTRPRYACVMEKKIENKKKYIYYRQIVYNGYHAKYEIDDLILDDNIEEFARKYEIKDNPLKKSDLKSSSL